MPGKVEIHTIGIKDNEGSLRLSSEWAEAPEEVMGAIIGAMGDGLWEMV